MQNLKTALKKEENWSIDKINGLVSLKNQVVHTAFVSLNPTLEKEYDNIVDLVWKVGHYRMIEEFRKRLKLQKKLVNSFRVFLADATKFYLFWIKGWAQAYDLVRVKEIVVSRLDVYESDYGPDFVLAPLALSPELQDKVSKTIHRSLIYLGDLARYRELHVPINGKREKLWSLARNFYTLAIWLFPENGNPFNQLAVIESYEGNEMGALEYYFKSLSVTTPFSTGFDNVIVLLKKISIREGSKDMQPSVSQYLILMHSALLIEKNMEKFSQHKMSFLKELYQNLVKGQMINSRYLKSIWSHSALQSLGGQDGKERQFVLWDLSMELIGMILKYVTEGQNKLDICFNALKLYLRFLLGHLDNIRVVDSFRDNIRPLIISYFNRFVSEYSYLLQQALNLELLREDVENIGWLLFVNDPTSPLWTLDKLNENPMDEKRVREMQILFLGLQLEKYPKLGVTIVKNREIPHFVPSSVDGQENVTPQSMQEDALHPVLSNILQKMDDESEDQEIFVYKGRQAQSKPANSPSNFWGSSFKSDLDMKHTKSYSGTPMSGNVKALAANDMAQDLPSDGVNTMSFLGLVSSPMANRQGAPFATPTGNGSLRQTFSMPPLQQTPSDFFGSPMGIDAMGAPSINPPVSDNNSGFSIPPPPGFTRFGQQPQQSLHPSNSLDSPWSKQITSSPLINPSMLTSPGSMPPVVGGSHNSSTGPVSPWLNAGASAGLTGHPVTNTSNVFLYVRPPSESSPAWFNQNPNNPEDQQGKQKLFNAPPQSYTHW